MAIVVQRGPIVLEEVLIDADSEEDAPPQIVRVYTEQAFDAYVFGGADNIELFRSRFDLQLRNASKESAHTAADARPEGETSSRR